MPSGHGFDRSWPSPNRKALHGRSSEVLSFKYRPPIGVGLWTTNLTFINFRVEGVRQDREVAVFPGSTYSALNLKESWFSAYFAHQLSDVMSAMTVGSERADCRQKLLGSITPRQPLLNPPQHLLNLCVGPKL